MCAECDAIATNPTDEQLQVMQRDLERAVRCVSLSIRMTLGDARSPIEGAVRIAAAMAWARIMELGVDLSPACQGLVARLVNDYVASTRSPAPAGTVQ